MKMFRHSLQNTLIFFQEDDDDDQDEDVDDDQDDDVYYIPAVARNSACENNYFSEIK